MPTSVPQISSAPRADPGARESTLFGGCPGYPEAYQKLPGPSGIGTKISGDSAVSTEHSVN